MTEKQDEFLITVRTHSWKGCYEQTALRAKKLIEAGIVDFSIERIETRPRERALIVGAREGFTT